MTTFLDSCPFLPLCSLTAETCDSRSMILLITIFTRISAAIEELNKSRVACTSKYSNWYLYRRVKRLFSFSRPRSQFPAATYSWTPNSSLILIPSRIDFLPPSTSPLKRKATKLIWVNVIHCITRADQLRYLTQIAIDKSPKYGFFSGSYGYFGRPELLSVFVNIFC